jgi:hypothetical protein
MLHRVTACLTILALSTLPAWTADRTVLRASQLNSDPDTYDGQDVVVKGYAILEPHNHLLYDSRKAFTRRNEYHDNDKHCLTIINPGFLFRAKGQSWDLTKHTLTLSGKFFAHYLDRVVDLGACGGRPGFTIRKIIRIEK